jgi:hypothetical protein
VELSPKGSPSFDSNLSEIYSPFNSICNVENVDKIDKVCAGFNTDFAPSGSALGLTPVRSRDRCADTVLRDSSLTVQRGQGSGGQSACATLGDAAGGASSCTAQQDRLPSG